MDLLVSKQQLLEALKASFEMHMTVLFLPIDRTTPHLVLHPCSILKVILLSLSLSQISSSFIGNSLWIGTPPEAICQTPMLAAHGP
ncbi:hypothetical protein AAC387_Pa03g2604 [Persea americana]